MSSIRRFGGKTIFFLDNIHDSQAPTNTLLYYIKFPFNPFISITPSKPLMPSRAWLTLHNCKIFYLLAVNYAPSTTDLIFIRVNIYPGPGKGGS